MGKEQHSMDELFRTVLKDLETHPPADAWFNIQKELDSRKKNRFIWTLRALAATITLLVTFASGYFIATYKNNSSQLAEKQSVQSVTKDIISQSSNSQSVSVKASRNKTDNLKGSHVQNKEILLNTSNLNKIAAKDQPDENINSTWQTSTIFANTQVVNESASSENYQLSYLLPIPLYGIISRQEDYRIIVREIRTSPSGSYLQNEIFLSDQEPAKENSVSRWSLGGQVSPLYAFRETSGSSAPAVNNSANQTPTSATFKESGIVSYAGGLNVEFKASKRLSVSSGIYYSRMGQNINGNLTNPSYINVSNVRSNQYFNYAFQNSTGTLKTNTAIVNTPVSDPTNNKNTYDLTSSFTTKSATLPPVEGETASLFQSMDFVEIPVIFRYKLTDKKIGIHLLGGMSTQVLAGNKVTLETATSRQDYGTTSGLSTFNYSSTLGFGIDYTVSANIHFNLEPAFKYYINSINSSGNLESHPYSFGVYTGVRYTF